MTDKDGLCFLLVDDNDMMMTLTIRALKNAGEKHFIRATSASEALKKLKEQEDAVFEQKINFIITDWEMPKMTGIELAVYLRGKPDYYDIPILITSDEITNNKKFYAIEEGIDDCLKKPYSEKALTDNVIKIFESKKNLDPIKKEIRSLKSIKQLKDCKQSIDRAKSLLDKYPDEVELQVILGNFYLTTGDFQNASILLKKSLEHRKTSRAFHLLGKTFIENKQFKNSIDALKKAHEINPLNKEIMIDLGRGYLGMDDIGDAQKIFKSIKETDLSDLNKTKIGGAYLKSNDLETAGQYLDDAEPLMTDAIEIFNQFAIQLRKQGKMDASLEQYKKCLNVAPDHPVVRFNLAVTYFQMKEYIEAKAQLTKCLQLKPKYEDANKLLTVVNQKLKC